MGLAGSEAFRGRELGENGRGRGIPEAVWGPQCAGPEILTASSEFGVV